MRKLVIALVAVSVLALPAHAQRRGAEQGPTPEEIQRKRDAAELDQKYKAAIKVQSATQTNTKKDPWANMRSSSDGTNK
jgi:Flp pilus assembly protein TadD